MGDAFEKAYEEVKKLVHNFESHKDHYMDSSYQEAEARQDFIDKFFTALGWDVTHQHQTNPYKQEVKVEKNIKTGHSQRRADYAFTIAPNYRDVKFYVEAKKPSVEIESKDVYFQIIRYGWNSKTPIGVVTDFEQFHVVDCRYRPNINTALDQKVKDLQFYYTDYLDKDKFAKIYWLFSHEAVADNSIEDFAAKLPKRRGKAVQKGFFRTGMQDIDESFLEDLDSFRADLAHMFKKADDSLDGLALTEMVQRTIDRLVFLRFLEDKLIETHYRISDFGNSGSYWRNFIAVSRKLDGIYNGVVFKKHDLLDAPAFHVNAEAFGDICEKLSHDHTPYDFNIIPIHILGSIYERFLGKVIVATAKRAHVEEKPEVRKAGGVYYTPEYIVRYIVENTIGKLIEGKHPSEIAKMRFADISCGSGSFLLGAYDYLLEYHRQWYNDNLKQPRLSDCYKHEDGTLHLTLEKKREILLNNIYGVDIDHQAVEVSQLSLYLKLLEEETTASASQFLLGFEQERQRKQLLPSLNSNIKCGNSLIGPDFYDQQELELDDDEHRRINVFDWESAFPEIFSNKNPGFDSIIGNPPYGAYLYEGDKAYLNIKYPHQSYQLDTYLIFLECSHELLNQNGLYGMIIPNPWLTNLRQEGIRKFIVSNFQINEIVHFQFSVFPKVTVDTEIVLLRKALSKKWRATASIVNFPDALAQSTPDSVKHIFHDQQKWQLLNGKVINIFLSEKDEALAAKCLEQSKLLDNYCAINVGIKPYQTGKGKPPQTKEVVKNRPFDSDYQVNESYRLYLRGRDIGRYEITPLETRYLKFGPWLAEPRGAANFNAPIKLFMRQTGDSLIATIDTDGYLCLNNMHVIVPVENFPSPLYLLGIINSKLLDWYYHTLNPEVGEALAEVKKTNVAKLPIYHVEASAKKAMTMYNDIIKLVERMLKLHKKRIDAKTDANKNMYQSQIASADRQIDKLVYELYDFTDKEIAIVEESSSNA